MTLIETHLRVGEGFVPLGVCPPRVADPNYVEGAISLSVDGVVLLTLEEWDDVNWLWGCLGDFVSTAMAGEEATMFFPSQPIEMRARTSRRPNCLDLEVVGSPPRRVTAEAGDFVIAFREAACSFWRWMLAADPRGEEKYRRMLAALEALPSRTRAPHG